MIWIPEWMKNGAVLLLAAEVVLIAVMGFCMWLTGGRR